MPKNIWGESKQVQEALFLIHSILRPYAVAEHNASQDAQNAPGSTEQGEKVVGVMQGGEA